MAAAPDDLPLCSTLRHQVLFDKLDDKSNKMVGPDMFSSDRSKFKEMIAPVTLKGVSIAALWANTFSGYSTFLREYHDRRKNADLDFHKWELCGDKSSGTRQFSCQTIVEVPRAGSFTLLNEAHRFAFSSCDGGPKLLIHISSQTPNVPAGSTFRCEALIQITADSPDGDCCVSVYGGMKKMSAMFSAIAFIATPRALKDMTAAYMVMMELVSEKLQGGKLTLKAATEPLPVTAPVKEVVTPTESPPRLVQPEERPQSWLSVAMLVLAFVVVLAVLLSVSTLNSINTSLQRVDSRAAAVAAAGDDAKSSPLFSALHGEGADDAGRGSGTMPGDAPPVFAAVLARNEAALHKVLAVVHDLNARLALLEESVAASWRVLYWILATSIAGFGGIMYYLQRAH